MFLLPPVKNQGVCLWHSGPENKFKEVFVSRSKEDTDEHLVHLLDDENLNKLSHESYARVIKKENYKVLM